MTTVQIAELPANALLSPYASTGAYTDCYSTNLALTVSLPEFIEAFYTTTIFKVERFILAQVLRLPSTDRQARGLAQGNLSQFAAWEVEAREADQAILAAGRTRSWLMVQSQTSDAGGVTTLFFGSAVVPDPRGSLGWQFKILLGFHKLYSRILLGSAARRLTRGRS